jgi:predicted nucleic acid-binding protein
LGLSACVLNSDVVIAGLDRADANHAVASTLLRDLAAAGATLLISAVNYAEVLVRPAEDERTLRTAVDAIAALGIRPVPATGEIARDAARLRARGVGLPDGFALATAVAKTASLASFDRRLARPMREAGVAPAISRGLPPAA